MVPKYASYNTKIQTFNRNSNFVKELRLKENKDTNFGRSVTKFSRGRAIEPDPSVQTRKDLTRRRIWVSDCLVRISLSKMAMMRNNEIRTAVATNQKETALIESSNLVLPGSSRWRFVGASTGGHWWNLLVLVQYSFEAL